ncbi:TPA: transcriptional regulator [Citrobacter freundii]|nr:transcriptional regulator [Citrobacter freundii]ELK6409156.1 transcriptional regulator [Citrobacter freundii]HCJ7758077.1 transcriptional regulator [Citrobacter freundii]HEI8930999.1 transcriptional regulator [Citrobacter freundii]
MSQQELLADCQDDSILEHFNNAEDTEQTRFPTLLAELNSLIRAELVRLDIDPRHSLELVIAISRHIGGMQLYFPKGQALEYLVRDMKIWRDFTGDNINELVERYHVSYKTVYKAIKRMRRLEHRKHQMPLF